jgi:hypothetical protein
MCYARTFMTRKKETRYPNLMSSPQAAPEPKRRVYATAYARAKEIICACFRPRVKDEPTIVV